MQLTTGVPPKFGLYSSVCTFSYQISPDDTFTITKDGPIHKLLIIGCKEEHSGKYRFEADGRKTEAMVSVKGLRICHDKNNDFLYGSIIGKGKKDLNQIKATLMTLAGPSF